jgi:sigma-B regulation protein RsbU (phosphoserine phosphatase)
MASSRPTDPSVTRTQAASRSKGNVRQFWHRVSDGLELNQLWSQLEKDARSSYHLYSAGLDDVHRDPRWVRSRWQLTKALFWAILEKLTPARRVLVLLGLVLLFLPTGGFTEGHGGNLEVHELDLHVWGGLLLFIVLLMELADRVVMKRDLEIAKDIQAWLLPGAPLQLPGYQIAYATRPANTVAGDYYDVILRPAHESNTEQVRENQVEGNRVGEDRLVENKDRILFVVADVAGKSIPAAMLMATFQASLRTLSTSGIALAELVSGVNHYACSNSQGGVRFTTGFFAELDPATGDLAYVNAGHNVPILRKKSGALERLEAGGLPVGIFRETPYQIGTTRLESGDWLVIFTDGIVEAFDSKEEEYGETALIRLIDRESESTPAELLPSLLADLDRHVGNTPQHDDMTCLLLKRT